MVAPESDTGALRVTFLNRRSVPSDTFLLATVRSQLSPEQFDIDPLLSVE